MPTLRLDALAHALRPRLRPEDARPQRELLEIHTQLRPLVEQVQEVTRRATNGRNPEIFQHGNLPFGVASRYGDHRRPERFRAVMRAKTAGEQPVPVRVLQDVTGM